MNKIQFDFKGRHALITGGAQGIGFEIAKTFLTSGAVVTIADYSQDGLKAAAGELAGLGTLHTAHLDVANRESCAKLAAGLAAPLNILVNNAGITRDKSFAKMTDVEFDSVIQTNLTGVYNVTKALFEKFADGQPKRIINLASVVALYGNFGQTNYVAAKAGVIGMTKTWGKEFGRKGFTVNAIAPGFIRTKMTEAMPPEVLAGISAKVPLQRMGETSDIANACLFLASDGAGYINATTISVDGGLVL